MFVSVKWDDVDGIVEMLNNVIDDNPRTITVQDKKIAEAILIRLTDEARSNTVILWNNEISKAIYDLGLGNPLQRRLYEHWHSHECSRECKEFIKWENELIIEGY